MYIMYTLEFSDYSKVRDAVDVVVEGRYDCQEMKVTDSKQSDAGSGSCWQRALTLRFAIGSRRLGGALSRIAIDA